MQSNLDRGACIIINNWLRLKASEKLLIVSSKEYKLEANILKKHAEKNRSHVDIMIVEKSGMQVGIYFDTNEKIFDNYNAIIGATQYSLVTTRAAKRAMNKGHKFLSLPLSTNNNQSMLEFDFMTVDTEKSKSLAQSISKYIEQASVISVTTKLGTNLKFYKRNRKLGFFNGVVDDGNGYSSASIELYVPIEETMTEGKLILDGSYGYIGKVDKPLEISFSKGKINKIENSTSGNILSEYIKKYNDPNMYIASEFGIGLNSNAKCLGNCYIEDESAYGTFHIGFGRNIALGGILEASGHFDLVSLKPDIYADNIKIMDEGKIIVPIN